MSLTKEIQKLFERSPSPLDEPKAEALNSYVELLLRWSRRINLTGFRNPISAAEGLLYDGAELAPLLPRGATVLDIGSGAGGLAFCLASLRDDLRFHLVEPRVKRVVFLRTATRELSLSDRVEIIEARAENLPQDLLESIDVAMAQAVLPPDRWIPLGCTLVRQGGQVICLTAKPLDQSLILPPNLDVTAVNTYHLPRSGVPRCITALSKRG